MGRQHRATRGQCSSMGRWASLHKSLSGFGKDAFGNSDLSSLREFDLNIFPFWSIPPFCITLNCGWNWILLYKVYWIGDYCFRCCYQYWYCAKPWGEFGKKKELCILTTDKSQYFSLNSIRQNHHHSHAIAQLATTNESINIALESCGHSCCQHWSRFLL